MKQCKGLVEWVFKSELVSLGNQVDKTEDAFMICDGYLLLPAQVLYLLAMRAGWASMVRWLNHGLGVSWFRFLSAFRPSHCWHFFAVCQTETPNRQRNPSRQHVFLVDSFHSGCSVNSHSIQPEETPLDHTPEASSEASHVRPLPGPVSFTQGRYRDFWRWEHRFGSRIFILGRRKKMF